MGLCSRMKVLGYREVLEGVQLRWLPPRKVRKVANRRFAMGQYTQRSALRESPSTERYAARDARLEKIVPALTEYLTERINDDGQNRVTATISVSCEDGQWKVCLTDRAQAGGKWDFKLWRSAPTLEDALKAVDKELQSPLPEWRRFAKWAPVSVKKT
jgi:hypothetical protein